ncbi:MAG: RNA polymerase sigma factor [Planctomycetota bacterium]|nr:RNA polymerase sigma factor [Planctomycetota bacterium]
MPVNAGLPETPIKLKSDGFQALVRRAQAGDRQAMDKVLSAIRPELERLASRYADPTRPVESTTDLLQESCLRAWQKFETFQGGTNDEQTFAMFRAWVGQIVRRLGMTARRDLECQKRNPGHEIVSLEATRPGQSTTSQRGIDPPAPDPSPTAHARSGERMERVLRALNRLEDKTDAAILRMRLLEGLNLREIAQRLDVGYKKVWNRYQATLKRLRQIMKGLA